MDRLNSSRGQFRGIREQANSLARNYLRGLKRPRIERGIEEKFSKLPSKDLPNR